MDNLDVGTLFVLDHLGYYALRMNTKFCLWLYFVCHHLKTCDLNQRQHSWNGLDKAGMYNYNIISNST